MELDTKIKEGQNKERAQEMSRGKRVALRSDNDILLKRAAQCT
jgi:hypothetical protein